jgi:UDP-glucose 4-epimerase
MRALVTGGAGFIGSNLADALVARGDEVLVVDDLSNGRREQVPAEARFEQVDIRDGARLRALGEEFAPELVFHLAAQMDVRRSIDDPAFDASVNVLGTINVLEAARAGGAAQRVVNTSTGGGIYGEVDVMPTPETVAPIPMAAYGQSKQCAELYCGWAERLHGLRTVSLRYGNVFGPRQDPAGDAGVIAIFAGRALRGQRPTVFGDGLQTRDYTFVDDIVRANLLAAEHPDAQGAYNIGTGVESTVLDVVEAVREAAGTEDFEPEFAPARRGELQRSSLDVSRAQRELGFRAEVSLKEGMRRTLEWVRTSGAA